MTILPYFRNEKKEKVKEPVFDIVLVDIRSSVDKEEIICIKRNMYDEELEYIAVSYRCGEFNKQLVETPDYKAHVTSFGLHHLLKLCKHIPMEQDLKGIQYLWIDGISVDQQNNERKKKVMAHISEIYKRATYILAIPDLHYAYLQENPANIYLLDSIEKNWRTIYIGILNNYQPVDEEETQDIRHAYSFLVFLICDWSDRAWIISQIHIAKEKQENHGTPLKYMFMSLLHPEVSTFFSYLFDHQPTTVNTNNNVNNIDIYNVDSSSKFIQLLNARLSQRQYIDMLLNSRALKNEDRFNAILPIWKKYKHVIKDKNTISSWNITNMTSVRLKLYEIMDDLWDKARLLYACSKLIDLPTFPSYANRHRGDLLLIEKDAVDIAYKEYSTTLSECAIKKFGNDDCVQQVIMNCGLIYTENLIDVQLNPRHHYLSVRAKKYFVSSNDSMPDIDLSYLSRHSLEKESLVCIYIPFFTFAIPGFTDVSHKSGSFIQLIGNYNQNRWMIFLPNFDPSQVKCYTNDYTFNIY